METTRRGDSPPYIGADLTDRHAASPRAIDVCGITPGALGRLRASYWEWRWNPGALAVGPIAAEIGAARGTLCDGPQALAAPGQDARACERATGTPGRTPDAPPAAGPSAGFLRSSVELFRALAGAGVAVSPAAGAGGVGEVFPHHAWTILAGRPLPPKGSALGQIARRAILQALGVQGLPDVTSHDQTDACLAAVLAAAADGAVPGLVVGPVGDALQVDADGTLREGPIVTPTGVTAELASRLDHALAQPALRGKLSEATIDRPVAKAPRPVPRAPAPAPPPPPAPSPPPEPEAPKPPSRPEAVAPKPASRPRPTPPPKPPRAEPAPRGAAGKRPAPIPPPPPPKRAEKPRPQPASPPKPAPPRARPATARRRRKPPRPASPARRRRAALPPAATGSPARRASALLRWLAARARAGEPALCTYGFVRRFCLGGRPRAWSPALTRAVAALAAATRPVALPRLGRVRLDAFIVSRRTRQPGAGHWAAAPYTPAAWRTALGQGRLLVPPRPPRGKRK